MSKRAPTAETVRVQRATRPSTASSTSAATARAVSAPSDTGPRERVRDQRRDAADEHRPRQRDQIGGAEDGGARPHQRRDSSPTTAIP